MTNYRQECTRIVLDIQSDSVRRIILRCLRGEISPFIAAMQLLMELEDVYYVSDLVETITDRVSACCLRDSSVKKTLFQLRLVLQENHESCLRIVEMLRAGLCKDIPSLDKGDGPAFFASMFDWAVSCSEEASVALYSLGNPQFLLKATREVIDLLDLWGVLDCNHTILQIGCGIGRFEVELAKRVKDVYGLDVSANMVQVAQHRCAELSNVHLFTTSGQDLAFLPANSFELVYSVDTFPYIFLSGESLVKKHFLEVSRVLCAGGDFIIFNYSYRDDIEADRRDVAHLASANSFEILVNGERPFSVWDGTAWRLRLTTEK